jgi:hypothetical protein
VAADPRTDQQIRSEISAEREQLVEALADLREGVRAKRNLAAAVAALTSVAVATAASIKLVRRFRGS